MGHERLPPREQRLATRGQTHRAHRPVKQRCANADFKFSDGLRYRRLSHLKMHGALRHPAKLDGHHEHFQRVEIKFLR